MKNRNSKLIISSIITLSILTGCVSTQPGLVNNSNENTKKGGIIGAITGAIVGLTQSDKKHRTRNTIMGAIGGGAAGALVGYSIDQQANEVANALGTHVDNDPLSKLDPQRSLIVSKTDKYVKIMFRDKMMFATNSDNLTGSAAYKVSKVAALLKRYPQTVVGIAGFTDNRGGYSYNQDLSSRRAKSVANRFYTQGLQNSIQTKGCSYQKSIVPNSSPANMALNRRVEIFLVRGDLSQVDMCR